jgi:hypothetical protein
MKGQYKTISLPMLVLAGQHRQGDPHETLTDERSEELSSMVGGRYERISTGPPFSFLAKTPGLRWGARMLVFVAVLMSWDDAATLGARFRRARRAVTAMFPTRRTVGTSYQGFLKRLLVLEEPLLRTVTLHLRGVLEQMAGPFWTREGLQAFAIDGSRIECPRTKANEAAFGHAGKKGCGPQMWLTTLWHMGTGLPWAWKQGRSDECERSHLRQMLDLLPAGALVVGDAGFVGYELLGAILAGGRSFLVRIGSNVRLLKELGWVKRYGEGTVFLWPMKHRDQEPMVLRLIELQRDGKKVYLLTNLPAESLSTPQAGALYGMRWGIEVFYRSLKQTLEHRTMRSRAPAQARAELAWSLIGLQLMGLMSVREMIAKGDDPLGWSVSASRELIRQAMQGHRNGGLGVQGWKNRLAACQKDRYVRTSSKKSRDWPDRKQEHPPGPPKIRTASQKEVRRAQELLAKLRAA